MIVDGRLSFARIFVSLGQPLLLTVAVSLLVTAAYSTTYGPMVKWRPVMNITPTPLSVIGAALSIFIAFRTNTVYSRWWDARTLWGALTTHSRGFVRQLDTFTRHSDAPGDREEMEAWRKAAVLRHIGFVYAFRDRLRDTDPLNPQGLCCFVAPEEMPVYEKVRNVPSAVLHQQGRELCYALKRGWILDFHLPAIDATLTDIARIQGGCERIKNTPLPPIYTFFAYRLMVWFCCLVPLGLVSILHWFTPAVSVIIAFAFMALNHISHQIETPFSTRDNDLPLSALCRAIEIDLRERVNALPIPESVKPVKGVLL